MPKAHRSRPEPSVSPFPVTRQFTAPPFFMGLEDARLKSRLLLEVVKQGGPATETEKLQAKPAAKRKRRAATAKASARKRAKR